MIKHAQHIVLLRVQPFELLVKQHKAGFAGENTVETPLQFTLSFVCRITASRNEVAKAETRCSDRLPFARLWLRREVLPSLAICPSLSGQTSATQDEKQAENS